MSTEISPVEPVATYELRYVAFVDILGFAGLVERSKTSPTQVQQLYTALSSLSARVLKEQGEGAQATNFSDTVVMSTTITAEGLKQLFSAVSGFTLDLLEKNMLLRGAIVRGDLMHTRDITFGPALVDAYRLETTTSFHPRVIIDSPVLDDIQNYSSGDTPVDFSKFVVSDSYDVPYLNPFSEWQGEPSLSKESIVRLITLQATITTGLVENATQPSVCEKYKWLARKLNNFISQRNSSEIALIEVD